MHVHVHVVLEDDVHACTCSVGPVQESNVLQRVIRALMSVDREILAVSLPSKHFEGVQDEA